MSTSNLYETKGAKALGIILCIIFVICVTCTGLFVGGLLKAKGSVPEKTTEKPKTTEYVHPMFRIFQHYVFNSTVF